MKRLLIGISAFLLHQSYSAAQGFQPEFGNARKPFVEAIATPNHADSHYRLGQQATLRLTAREGGVPLNGIVVHYKVGPEMLLPQKQDSTTFVAGEAVIRMGTLTEPGFLACQFEYVCGGKRQTDLVKVAYEPEQIRTFTPMPDDFQIFWQQALKEARRVPFEPEYSDVDDATNDKVTTQYVRLRGAAEMDLRLPHPSAGQGGQVSRGALPSGSRKPQDIPLRILSP